VLIRKPFAARKQAIGDYIFQLRKRLRYGRDRYGELPQDCAHEEYTANRCW
jgi:hypothetical protein